MSDGSNKIDADLLTRAQRSLVGWLTLGKELETWSGRHFTPLREIDGALQYHEEFRRFGFETVDEFSGRCVRLIIEHGVDSSRVRMLLDFYRVHDPDKCAVAEAAVSLRQLSDEVEEANKPAITPDGPIPVPAWMDAAMGWAPLALLGVSATFVGIAIFEDLRGKIVSVFGAGVSLALACNAWMAVRCVNEAKRRKGKAKINE